MKNILILLLFVVSLTTCQVEETFDLNGPSLDAVIQNAQLSDIQNLVSGTESAMRVRLGTYYDAVSVIGREYYRISNSDPRFTGDLLGKTTSTLDNNTFYTTGPFAARYAVVKNCNIMIDAVSNTTAAISDVQKIASIGFARTIQAYSLLLVLNQQYSNGIRLEVSSPSDLGPFVSLSESLVGIRQLLDGAYAQLTPAGDASFVFTLSDFPNVISSFAEFNRAITARVALYQNDLSGVLSALGNSFFDLTGDINGGIYHSFSTAGADLPNPLFYTPNSTGETILVHPSLATDALTGDTRFATKVGARETPLTFDELTSGYDLTAYASQSASIPIIRNEELILIYAEANRTSNSTQAVAAIDAVRSAVGLEAYSGATTPDALLTEILFQRRYSLLGEGHRWIDVRRYNLLSTLPIDREGDDVFESFPRPATEN